MSYWAGGPLSSRLLWVDRTLSGVSLLLSPLAGAFCPEAARMKSTREPWFRGRAFVFIFQTV